MANWNAEAIHKEAETLVHTAELGGDASMQQVHKALNKDMHEMSADTYNKLLLEMSNINKSDVMHNGHLPVLELFASENSALPDSAKLNYEKSKSLQFDTYSAEYVGTGN